MGQQSAQKPNVIKAAAAMSLGTIFSRLLGYVRDAVMLAAFSRTVTDAFVVAFRLPNLVRRLLGEGSLSVSFIPVYIDQLNHDDGGERARRLANATFTLLCSVTVTLTALAWLLMPEILGVWVGDKEGFAAVAGKMELTIEFARIMIIYVVLVTTYAFWMGMANALKKFFVPALAPAVFNLLVIVFALLPAGWLPVPGALLAWGVVVGGAVQAAMVAVLLYRLGHLPRFKVDIRAPGLKTVLINMVPGMVGLGIYQVMTIVNTFFAAKLPEGTQSFIYAADRILELPQSIIAISLGTALLPTFSHQLSRGERQEMLTTASEGMSAMLFLALPAGLGMWLLSTPIIEVLFMRGAFGPEDVAATASIVEVYALLLVVSSLSKVTVPGFYAMKNTWLPMVSAAVALVVHIALCALWVEHHGVVGLAAATATSAALNMVGLQVAFRVMIGALRADILLVRLARLVPALIALAAVVHFVHGWLTTALADWWSVWTRGFALVVAIGFSSVVYFLIASLCRVPEAQKTLSILRRRLRL